MRLNDYVELALRTAALPSTSVSLVEGPGKPCPKVTLLPEAKVQLIHGALGISSEVSELLVASDRINELEELGDICWYAALILHYTGQNTDKVWTRVQQRASYEPTDTPVSDLQLHAGDICDAVKRIVFYGQDCYEQLELGIIATLAAVLIRSRQLESNIERVFTSNIAKLLARYPHKFSARAAMDRKIDQEMLAHLAALSDE